MKRCAASRRAPWKIADVSSECRRGALTAARFLAENIVRYCYRPFDVRWLYWEPETSYWTKSGKNIFRNSPTGNVCYVARQQKP